MPPENTPALTTERSLTPLPACWLSDFKTLPWFVFISEHLTIRRTHTHTHGGVQLLCLASSRISLLSLCYKQIKCRHINEKLKGKKKTQTNRASHCIIIIFFFFFGFGSGSIKKRKAESLLCVVFGFSDTHSFHWKMVTGGLASARHVSCTSWRFRYQFPSKPSIFTSGSSARKPR